MTTAAIATAKIAPIIVTVKRENLSEPTEKTTLSSSFEFELWGTKEGADTEGDGLNWIGAGFPYVGVAKDGVTCKELGTVADDGEFEDGVACNEGEAMRMRRKEAKSRDSSQFIAMQFV